MMTPYFETENGKLYHGDVLSVLSQLPDGSVQMCVTSPPYWGLRDYGLEPQTWDDPGNCAHVWNETEFIANKSGGPSEKQQSNAGAWNPDGILSKHGFCQNCNAWRGSLGLEPTPDLFINHLVQIFRGVKRVLRSDGVLFVNMGDSYASTGGDYKNGSQGKNSVVGKTSPESCPNNGRAERLKKQSEYGIKPKDLIGVPWMLAFALRADGWYLRSDIIWAKTNPMPESVTDRPTKSHEYIFLLSKSQRYFYDAEAIKEPDSGQQHHRNVFEGAPSLEPSGGLKSSHKSLWGTPDKNGNGRNKRTVWTIPTAPFSEAHFATFPPKLIEPCIFAGSPEGGTVFDPFFGAGTTGLVCEKYGRKWIGIELNQDYADIAAKRIDQEAKQLKMF